MGTARPDPPQSPLACLAMRIGYFTTKGFHGRGGGPGMPYQLGDGTMERPRWESNLREPCSHRPVKVVEVTGLEPA